MKKNLRRMLSFVLVFAMFSVNICVAFATEDSAMNELPVSWTEANGDTSVVSSSDVSGIEWQRFENRTGIQPLTNVSCSGVVTVATALTLFPVLESYVGFTQTFVIRTMSDSYEGELLLTLKDSTGRTYLSSYPVGMNVNTTKSFWLPNSGRYTLTVFARGTPGSVTITAGWKA